MDNRGVTLEHPILEMRVVEKGNVDEGVAVKQESGKKDNENKIQRASTTQDMNDDSKEDAEENAGINRKESMKGGEDYQEELASPKGNTEDEKAAEEKDEKEGDEEKGDGSQEDRTDQPSLTMTYQSEKTYDKDITRYDLSHEKDTESDEQSSEEEEEDDEEPDVLALKRPEERLSNRMGENVQDKMVPIHEKEGSSPTPHTTIVGPIRGKRALFQPILSPERLTKAFAPTLRTVELDSAAGKKNSFMMPVVEVVEEQMRPGEIPLRSTLPGEEEADEWAEAEVELRRMKTTSLPNRLEDNDDSSEEEEVEITTDTTIITSSSEEKTEQDDDDDDVDNDDEEDEDDEDEDLTVKPNEIITAKTRIINVQTIHVPFNDVTAKGVRGGFRLFDEDEPTKITIRTTKKSQQDEATTASQRATPVKVLLSPEATTRQDEVPATDTDRTTSEAESFENSETEIQNDFPKISAETPATDERTTEMVWEVITVPRPPEPTVKDLTTENEDSKLTTSAKDVDAEDDSIEIDLTTEKLKPMSSDVIMKTTETSKEEEEDESLEDEMTERSATMEHSMEVITNAERKRAKKTTMQQQEKIPPINVVKKPIKVKVVEKQTHKKTTVETLSKATTGKMATTNPSKKRLFMSVTDKGERSFKLTPENIERLDEELPFEETLSVGRLTTPAKAKAAKKPIKTTTWKIFTKKDFAKEFSYEQDGKDELYDAGSGYDYPIKLEGKQTSDKKIGEDEDEYYYDYSDEEEDRKV